MKIILGGKHLETPIGSSVSIQGSMSDAVPKCNVALYDEDSSIEIECPQEMIVIDEKEIENPTWNMLRNPEMDPYTSEWWQTSKAGITMSSVVGGGVRWTFNNAATEAFTQQTQYTYQTCVAGGQTYNASCYAVGENTPTNIRLNIHVYVVDLSNAIVLSQNQDFTITTSLARYDFSFSAPVSADRGNIFLTIRAIANAATNSGDIVATKAQLEPEWFPTQTYPSPWCGPDETDCRQLPNLTWIRQYRKFGGFVVSPSYDDYHGSVRTVLIQAVGYAWLLGTIYPAESYSSQYDSYILGDLADTYLVSADPRGGTPSYTMVNKDNIVQGVQITSFVVPRDDAKTVCNNLASQIGFYWTIDAYWNMIYAPPGYFVSSYSLICDNSATPDMTTTFPAYNFSRTDDLTQPGSNILVVGGGSNVAQVIDPVRVRELGYISGYFLPTNSSWMRKVQATELGNIADCNQRGIAELLQYSKTRSIYKLATDACELVAGQAISVTSSTDGLNSSSLLLQSVTARWIGTDELLHDKWEYEADLGGMNRQIQNILNRLFKKATSSATAPAVTQTSLVIFEPISMVDTPSTGTTATGYQATVLGDSPLAYYRLGELMGTTADDFSGHAYHGTLHGGITLGSTGLLAGDSDTAMTFNGSTGYISLPTTFEPTGASAWSIEAWVSTTAWPGAGFNDTVAGWGTMANRQAAMLKISATGATSATFMCSAYNGDVSGGIVALSTTYHMVGTYDGTNMRLYVNGVLVAGPTAYTLNIANAFAMIGAYHTTPAEFATGSIDEVAIYGATLSLYRIQQHYAVGSSAYAPLVRADAPIAYYRLGETTGTTIYDWSSGSHNGTIGGTVTLGQTGALTGDVDTCALFDGSTGHVALPAGVSVAGLSAFSIECWIYASSISAGSYPRIISNDYTYGSKNGFDLTINGDDSQLVFVVGNGSSSAFAYCGISAATWYHVVCTFNGANSTVYLNGAQNGFIGTISGTVGTAAYIIDIGRHPADDAYYAGNIDEIAIYNYALSASQVLAHYNAGI